MFQDPNGGMDGTPSSADPKFDQPRGPIDIDQRVRNVRLRRA